MECESSCFGDRGDGTCKRHTMALSCVDRVMLKNNGNEILMPNEQICRHQALAIHNPVGMKSIIYSGSWRGRKAPEWRNYWAPSPGPRITDYRLSHLTKLHFAHCTRHTTQSDAVHAAQCIAYYTAPHTKSYCTQRTARHDCTLRTTRHCNRDFQCSQKLARHAWLQFHW